MPHLSKYRFFVRQAHWDLPEKNSKIPGDPSGLAWQKTGIWTDGATKLAIKKSASLDPLEFDQLETGFLTRVVFLVE